MPDPVRLTPAARRRLRGRAHALKPTVIVGAAGASEALIGALDEALEDHGLVKVRVNAGSRAQRKTLIDELCRACRAELIQSVGHVAVLFREPEDEALRETFSEVLN